MEAVSVLRLHADWISGSCQGGLTIIMNPIGHKSEEAQVFLSLHRFGAKLARFILGSREPTRETLFSCSNNGGTHFLRFSGGTVEIDPRHLTDAGVFIAQGEQRSLTPEIVQAVTEAELSDLDREIRNTREGAEKANVDMRWRFRYSHSDSRWLRAMTLRKKLLSAATCEAGMKPGEINV